MSIQVSDEERLAPDSAGYDAPVPTPLRHGLVAVAVTVAGVLTCWLGALLAGGDPRRWQLDLSLLAGVLVVAAAARLLRLPPGPSVVAGAACLLAGGGLAALHGTPWAYSGIYSDAGFRTEAVTRFTDTRALVDYAYRGLPSYYPPALSWVQGLVADVVGVPGWAVMKPAQLVLSAVIPMLSWLWWRRLLPEPVAACVAAAVAVAVAMPYKPDEWLVLLVILPWWLELVVGVRRPDRAVLPAWVHGLVLGGLALCHTFFFAPLAIASVLWMLLERLLHHRVHLSVRRAVVVAVVGLVVASPSYVPIALLRLSGAPSDDLQLRWSPPGFQWPPLPGVGAEGVLGLVGLIWLVRYFGSQRLARALLLVWVVALAYLVVGQVLQPLGVAVLAEKAEELVDACMAATGALGLVAALRWAAAHWTRRQVVAVVGVAGLLGLVLVEAQLKALLYRPAQMAQHMRYPDGRWAAGGPPGRASTVHPWGITSVDPGASTDDVTGAWRRLTGRPLGSGDVVLSARADVLATTPVHAYITWKSIYSHPNGRFAQRLQVVRTLARCTTPDCAWRLLRDNPYDAVDAVVLNRDDRGYFLTIAVDDYPNAWRKDRIRFDPGMFAGPQFRTVPLDRAVLVVPRVGARAGESG